jgi:ribulose-5-phosphate 4-epimerase/fuculose-1-phosphate aldolase
MALSFMDVEHSSKSIPELSPRAEVALLARALYREGYSDGSIGHMTSRQDDDTYLILPADFGWDEARPEHVIRIDGEGNKLEGEGTVMPPIILHLEYHKLHPTCNWTVHQHPMFSTIWATVGRIPPVYYQRAGAVGGRIGLYDDYAGGVHVPEAARAAAEAVGDATATLLRNHGVFVVGDNVRQMYTRASALEGRSRMAWYVETLGGGREMPEYGQQALGESSKRSGGTGIPGLWEWAVRRELRHDPTLLT